MWSRTAWLIVLRDLVCLVLGVWGVVHEELTNTPDLARLGFFGVLMTAPGLLAARWLGRTTDGQSSAPPAEPSSSSPSSPPG